MERWNASENINSFACLSFALNLVLASATLTMSLPMAHYHSQEAVCVCDCVPWRFCMGGISFSLILLHCLFFGHFLSRFFRGVFFFSLPFSVSSFCLIFSILLLFFGFSFSCMHSCLWSFSHAYIG